MFGYGSFDNRNLTGDRKNLLITYETDVSNTEDFSYTSDDFFGILDDDSGDNIAQDMLRLGVGRYTPTSLEEAKNDVDKLEEYLTDDHYGAWRNNSTTRPSSRWPSTDTISAGSTTKPSRPLLEPTQATT